MRTIAQRYIHPQYNLDTWEFDIMLLKLSEPVPAGTPFVTLNSNAQEPSLGDTVTVVGLGRLKEKNGDVADVLQEVDVQGISQDLCSQMYPGWIKEQSMLCAGIPMVGQKDACYGDSGGPLLQSVGNGEVVQVGIVSFGTGCARADKPGVYSRVSAAYEWIDFSICEYTSFPGTRCGSASEPADAVRQAQESPSAAPSALLPDPSSAAPSVSSSQLESDMPSQVPSDSPSRMPSYEPSVGQSERPSANLRGSG